MPSMSKGVKYAIAAVAGVIVLLLILTFTVFIPQSVKSTGVKKEQSMSASYGQALADLHNCVAKTARAAQVSVANTDALDKILKDAVGGRYNQPGSPVVDSGKFFSAVQEAYPNLSDLSKTFSNALAVMTGCQDDFAADQKVVQTEVANFRTWKAGSYWTRNFGGNDFPDSNLVLQVNNKTYTGLEALKIIGQPIVDADTVNAVETGQDNSSQQNPFGPAPSPSSR